MNAALVDTDVVSFLYKRDSRASLYEAHVAGRLLGISFMTLAELERWAIERSWGTLRRRELADYMKKFVVLPASRELCRWWAEVSFQGRQRGRPLQTADAWIAATALLYEVPLITHNRRDYGGIAGLELISES
jgi:tRNA(fMet)-specific endonuclease VapC